MTVSRGLMIALLSGVLSGTALTTFSQQGSIVAALNEVPRTRPVNLQILSGDIATASLGRLMKRYEQDLGVTCSYCHVENRDTGKLDYASDENPRKQTARLMIGMLDDINDKYLGQLGGDARYAAGVTCGSCHQGRSSPPAFEPRWR
jgi:hypothetical protein